MKGLCETMCPAAEFKLRTKEGLVHFFEYDNAAKKTPNILVKEFSRSAAGHRTATPRELRTERCLQRTIEYLLKDIIMDKRKPYHYVYDFIFDRLRAVRQELVIQEFTSSQTIKLLEPMIMFLSYSRYRLCEDGKNFDAKICEQHLQECLKRALKCYDTLESEPIAENAASKPSKPFQEKNSAKNRNFIESLYQLFNLGSIEALQRAIQLPQRLREDPLFKQTYSIALHLHCGNYWRVFQGIKSLPHILCAIAALKLPQLRRKCLLSFAHAYNSKQLQVPIAFVCRVLLLDNEQQLYDDCSCYNIKVNINKNTLAFMKEDFKTDVPPAHARHEQWIEEKLKKIFLPDVILMVEL